MKLPYELKRKSIKVNLHDLWIGAYWKTSVWHHSDGSTEPYSLTIYICLLPAIPIELYFLRRKDEELTL